MGRRPPHRSAQLAEQHWNGEGDLVHAHHPVTPAFGRAAEEIAPGILTMISVAPVNAIDTGDGLAMLDTGGQFDIDHVFDQVRGWRPAAPVRAAVYSHHHVDHVFDGLRFEDEATERGWPQPVVYAHEALPDHFRRYERTLGWNTAINSASSPSPSTRSPGRPTTATPTSPTASTSTFTQGGLTFELHHARGETDDATWTFVPELGVLHPGDLFIWAVPNAGNPQKVQRFASDWAAALREMAGCGAEIMLCGHGLPIFGADRVRQALTDTADVLATIEAQTLVLMNRACRSIACSTRSRSLNGCASCRTSSRCTTTPSSSCATSGAVTAVVRRRTGQPVAAPRAEQARSG